MSIQRLLVDAAYRKAMIADVGNESVRQFWLTEFNRWNDRDRTQFVASQQNKLGAFTSNERLQAILCRSEQGIDLRSILNRSQILLANLSKGTVGHDASTLLGSLLLSSLFQTTKLGCLKTVPPLMEVRLGQLRCAAGTEETAEP